jgi:hypothetical protein
LKLFCLLDFGRRMSPHDATSAPVANAVR